MRDATDAKTLHLAQVSSRYDLTWAEFLEDVDAAVETRPHVLGFTEVGGRGLLEQALRHRGYAAFCPRAGDGALAVRMDGLQIIDRHNLQVSTASAPGIRPQYLTSITARWGAETLWLGEAHWLVPRNPQRWVLHERMTRAMIRSIQENAQGRRLGFFLGDLNVDDDDTRGPEAIQPQRLFRHEGLTTIYHELDEFPGTHGRRTIDVLGSYDLDRRVVGRRVQVRNQNADHDRAEAWYSITP